MVFLLSSLRGAKRRSNPHLRVLRHGLLRSARNDGCSKPKSQLRGLRPKPVHQPRAVEQPRRGPVVAEHDERQRLGRGMCRRARSATRSVVKRRVAMMRSTALVPKPGTRKSSSRLARWRYRAGSGRDGAAPRRVSDRCRAAACRHRRRRSRPPQSRRTASASRPGRAGARAPGAGRRAAARGWNPGSG